MDKHNQQDNMDYETSEEITIYRTFKSMQLREALLRGFYTSGFNNPSTVQQGAIVSVVQGRDVIGQRPRGTRKQVFSLQALFIIVQ